MSHRLEVVNGRITGWYCSVDNVYNDILTVQCCYCPETRPDNLNSAAITTSARRQGMMAETELYEKFFAAEIAAGKAIADNLEDEALLTENRRTLEEICYRAKVRLIPIYEKERQLKARKRPWLISSDTDESVEQSINEVKARQTRMSKIDKARELLAESIGVDAADEMIRSAVNKATDNNLSKSINKSKRAAKEIASIDELMNDEPFDFSKFGD